MTKEVQEKVGEDKKDTTETTTGKETINSEVLSVAKKSSSTSLKKLSQEELTTLDYSDFDTPGRMLALASVLVKGKMCPLKEPADVVIALLTGQSLGLPFITSISQIYPINGTPTLGTHVQKGIALKNGIIYKRTRHYEAMYMFVEADGESKPKIVDKKPVIISYGFLDEKPEGSLKKEVDRVTEYELTRELQLPSGKYTTITQKGSFSLSEARKAGLDQKDNWIKYPKDMLDARAFDRAMSEIADDLKHGLKSPEIISEGEVQEAIIVE